MREKIYCFIYENSGCVEDRSKTNIYIGRNFNVGLELIKKYSSGKIEIELWEKGKIISSYITDGDIAAGKWERNAGETAEEIESLKIN